MPRLLGLLSSAKLYKCGFLCLRLISSHTAKAFCHDTLICRQHQSSANTHTWSEYLPCQTMPSTPCTNKSTGRNKPIRTSDCIFNLDAYRGYRDENGSNIGKRTVSFSKI